MACALTRRRFLMNWWVKLVLAGIFVSLLVLSYEIVLKTSGANQLAFVNAVGLFTVALGIVAAVAVLRRSSRT